MNPKFEGQHTGEFLVSEANGTLSRAIGILAQREEPYTDGTVLARDGGELVAVDASGTEGVDPDSIAGVLYGNYNAADGPIPRAVYIARLAEVKEELLVLPPESTTGDERALVYQGLRRRHIIPR